MRTFFNIIIAAILIMMGVGLIWGILDGDSSSTSRGIVPSKWATWDGEGEEPDAYIVVVNDNAVRDQHISSFGNIYGTAYNRTGKNLSYIQITYGIYNESGAKLGSCLANENNIPAATPWKFSAMCTNLPDSAYRYRVDDVAYW